MLEGFVVIYMCGDRKSHVILDYDLDIFKLNNVYSKSYKGIMILSNKVLTYGYMKGVGIPSPKKYPIQQSVAAEEILNGFIVKCNQEVSVGIRLAFKVVIIGGLNEMVVFLG